MDYDDNILGGELALIEKEKLKDGRWTLFAAAAFLGEKLGEAKEPETEIMLGRRGKNFLSEFKNAVTSGQLIAYLPGDESKINSDDVRKIFASGCVRDAIGDVPYHSPAIYTVQVYWNKLSEWLKINETKLTCEFPNPDTPAAKVKAVRLSVAAQQNNTILSWLKSNKYDSHKLPVPPSGRAGVKKLCREALCGNCKQLFSSISVFNTVWERLRANGEIIDAK